MNKKIKVLITLAVLILLSIAFYFSSSIITKLTGKTIYSGNLDDFIECLSENNVKMYGAYWCGHCQNQKDLFQDSQIFISKIYVECDPRGENPQTDLCLEKGIQGYPTWEINGKLYSGEKTFEELAELSGCKLS